MGWLESHKPGAPVTVHLLLAGLMWTVVGAVLVVVGGRWLWRSEAAAASWLAALALGLGALKARFVLDRTARKTVERIRERGDGRCLGGFLSLRSWALVGIMAVFGRLLRGSHLVRHLLGFLYLAVGTALFLSSRVAWRAWRQSRRASIEGS